MEPVTPELDPVVLDSVKSLNDEIYRQTQQDFAIHYMEYMEHGNMPHSFYSTLPKGLQRRYRDKFRHLADHVNGRPRTTKEQAYAKRGKKKTAAKNKAAKQARKRNRS